MIIGDADGVVVVPRAIEHEVLKKALEKLESDAKRAERVSGKPEEIRKYLEDFLAR
jgi:4-hydroxy-4-methyl-2-oxoglutarate aldolase